MTSQYTDDAVDAPGAAPSDAELITAVRSGDERAYADLWARHEGAARRLALLQQEVNQCYWERKINKNLVELRNLVTVADLIVTCARMRKESRGLHQNIDYPETHDELFRRDSVL